MANYRPTSRHVGGTTCIQNPCLSIPRKPHKLRKPTRGDTYGGVCELAASTHQKLEEALVRVGAAGIYHVPPISFLVEFFEYLKEIFSHS
jgi:hypothetical protein